MVETLAEMNELPQETWRPGAGLELFMGLKAVAD